MALPVGAPETDGCGWDEPVPFGWRDGAAPDEALDEVADGGFAGAGAADGATAIVAGATEMP